MLNLTKDKKKSLGSFYTPGVSGDEMVKNNIANAHSIQANDNATQIVNVENSSDTKAKLALKIEDLKAEKQKWIDDELAKYELADQTDNIMKSVYQQAAARYNERLGSLQKAYDALSKLALSK